MASYSVNQLQQAAWLVYFNGLEIPVAGAEVRFGVWSMPTLTLDMVPHPLLQRLGAEDRIQVVLFYLDTHYNPDSPTFRLMGEFEIMGWGYSTSSRGRSLQFKCVSQMQIFEQMKFQRCEIDRSITYRQMFVSTAMIVVQVQMKKSRTDRI